MNTYSIPKKQFFTYQIGNFYSFYRKWALYCSKLLLLKDYLSTNLYKEYHITLDINVTQQLILRNYIQTYTKLYPQQFWKNKQRKCPTTRYLFKIWYREHRRFLRRGNTIWHCNNGHISLFSCPNPQNEHHQEWTRRKVWTLVRTMSQGRFECSKCLLQVGRVDNGWGYECVGGEISVTFHSVK